jgi:hypothetical protein
MPLKYHRLIEARDDAYESDDDWDRRSVQRGIRVTHCQLVVWSILIGTFLLSGMIGLVSWSMYKRLSNGE